MIDAEPYTVAGLALSLDIDRRTLLNYSKKEEFFPTIKKARIKIEKDVERRSIENNSAGAIFNLKNNFDYEDKQKKEHSGNLDITQITGMNVN